MNATRQTHKGFDGVRLQSLEQWRKLSPRQQGFVLYMQSELPGSELKGQKNPHKKGSDDHKAFQDGEHQAILLVQDSDDS